MNTHFEPRTLINGGMLKQFAGQTVSIMVRVESVAGTTLLANSTDNHKLRISLPSELGAAEGAWVEVIGNPNSADAIRAKEVIEFGGENIDFDTDGYNTMTQLLTNVKQFYQYG
ncbi:replication protein A 14 kDa subunit A [Drosophila grimshawi]|uniref:GH24192 n=1 Tax=Drosophila grimshawi TaxID=7222 RepID=B4JN76_DROGR|nr:replication protein A 14 kDa subunit A [Drosophila grimshawi]EDV92169.1 GH24192 [Drosophila grimshawi]